MSPAVAVVVRRRSRAPRTGRRERSRTLPARLAASAAWARSSSRGTAGPRGPRRGTSPARSAAACPAPAGRARCARTPPPSATFDVSMPAEWLMKSSRCSSSSPSSRLVVSSVVQMQTTPGWSWRFRPDAGEVARRPRSRARRSWAAGPMPESISSCGELNAPPQSTTSRAASKRTRLAVAHALDAGRARPSSTSTRVHVHACLDRQVRRARRWDAGRRPPRCSAGRRTASPGRRPTPSCTAALKSSLAGMPASIAPATNASVSGLPDLLERHAQRPAVAVVLARAELVVLGALEHRQDVVVAPAGIAEVAPGVVVGAVAADVDHRVRRRAAAERLAARLVDRRARRAAARARCGSPSRTRCRRACRTPPGCRSPRPRRAGRPRAAARSHSGSSLRRAASAQPAEPAPTIT